MSFISRRDSGSNGSRRWPTYAAPPTRSPAKSAFTVALGREAFYRQAEMDLADAYVYASEVMTQNMMAPDAAEGIAAFIEKRTPAWRDA